MVTFLRTLILAVLVAIVGWWTIFLRGKLREHEIALEERDEQIETLHGEVLVRDERIQELDVAIGLLKVDERVARVQVLSQGPHPDFPDDPEKVQTTAQFTEIDADGEPLGQPVEVTVDGKVLYLEALVVKFDDEMVETGDALRGTSICLFQRAFGENQKPSEGTPLDPVGQQPQVYRMDDNTDPFYLDLWTNFWEYANDPAAAAEKGVRAAHGEAPFMELRPGKSYRVVLRASDGLTIEAER